jgi:hypothetical protein
MLVPIQTVIKLLANKSNLMETTFEAIAQEARNILGDDPSRYSRESLSLLSGAASAPTGTDGKTPAVARTHSAAAGGRFIVLGNFRPQYRRQDRQREQVRKDFFCSHHGHNGTHNSDTCTYIIEA